MNTHHRQIRPRAKAVRRRVGWPAAALAVTAVLLAGCGSSDDAGSGSSAESGAGTTGAPVTSNGAGTAGDGSSSAAAGSGGGATASAGPASAVSSESSPAPESVAPVAPGSAGEVTLVTHDSFNMDKKVIADFEKQSGVKLTVLAQGDAGAMTNKLVLTKDNPLGDVVFGIDNTFASRALDADVLQPYASAAAANGADKYAIDDSNRLTAVDYGDVCVNVDHTWFTNKKLAEPKSYDDLTKPEYKDLLVVQSPATSSPGLAFLLGTMSVKGADGWQDYWRQLKANGVKVDAGWEDAYTVDFTGGSETGTRPLVVSYASSPPSTVKDGKATTGALLNTCFRQVEYTGVLAGAKNPDGAKKVVDFLLSKEFQQALPEQMYVYPVTAGVQLPAEWAKFAPVADKPATVDPQQIAENRQAWIGEWSDLMGQ